MAAIGDLGAPKPTEVARRLGSSKFRRSEMANLPVKPDVVTRKRNLVTALLMMRELSRGWRKATDLVESTGIHRRNIYRTLAAFRALGLDVETEARGRESYHRLSRKAVDAWLWRADVE